MSTTNVNAAHHLGAPPARASAKMTIQFGLVSLPVAIYTACDKLPVKGVSRSMYHPVGKGKAQTFNPVGKQDYDKVTGATLTSDDIVFLAAATDGTLVEITDDEVATVTGGDEKGLAAIECLVPMSAIGTTYLVERVYQCGPQTTGSGKAKAPMPGVENGLALLVRALQEKDAAALFYVALNGPARPACLLPSGHVAMLFSADAVRGPAATIDTSKVKERELAMAIALLESIGEDLPVLRDETGRKMAEYVDAKAKDPKKAAVAPAAEPEVAEVVDIAALLEASLSAAPAPVKAKRARKSA